jgi:hypothetical protein
MTTVQPQDTENRIAVLLLVKSVLNQCKYTSGQEAEMSRDLISQKPICLQAIRGTIAAMVSLALQRQPVAGRLQISGIVHGWVGDRSFDDATMSSLVALTDQFEHDPASAVQTNASAPTQSTLDLNPVHLLPAASNPFVQVLEVKQNAAVPDAAPRRRAVCRNWLKEGACKWGDKCHFLHHNPKAMTQAELEKASIPELSETVATMMRPGNGELQTRLDEFYSTPRLDDAPETVAEAKAVSENHVHAEGELDAAPEGRSGLNKKRSRADDADDCDELTLGNGSSAAVKMMRNMGWQGEGTALGATCQGMVVPINVGQNSERLG